jgi:hypothetical protein
MGESLQTPPLQCIYGRAGSAEGAGKRRVFGDDEFSPDAMGGLVSVAWDAGSIDRLIRNRG